MIQLAFTDQDELGVVVIGKCAQQLKLKYAS
jgi:hypothetical protein